MKKNIRILVIIGFFGLANGPICAMKSVNKKIFNIFIASQRGYMNHLKKIDISNKISTIIETSNDLGKIIPEKLSTYDLAYYIEEIPSEVLSKDKAYQSIFRYVEGLHRSYFFKGQKEERWIVRDGTCVQVQKDIKEWDVVYNKLLEKDPHNFLSSLSYEIDSVIYHQKYGSESKEIASLVNMLYLYPQLTSALLYDEYYTETILEHISKETLAKLLINNFEVIADQMQRYGAHVRGTLLNGLLIVLGNEQMQDASELLEKMVPLVFSAWFTHDNSQSVFITKSKIDAFMALYTTKYRAQYLDAFKKNKPALMKSGCLGSNEVERLFEMYKDKKYKETVEDLFTVIIEEDFAQTFKMNPSVYKPFFFREHDGKWDINEYRKKIAQLFLEHVIEICTYDSSVHKDDARFFARLGLLKDICEIFSKNDTTLLIGKLASEEIKNASFVDWEIRDNILLYSVCAYDFASQETRNYFENYFLKCIEKNTFLYDLQVCVLCDLLPVFSSKTFCACIGFIDKKSTEELNECFYEGQIEHLSKIGAFFIWNEKNRDTLELLKKACIKLKDILERIAK